MIFYSSQQSKANVLLALLAFLASRKSAVNDQGGRMHQVMRMMFHGIHTTTGHSVARFVLHLF